MTDNRPRNCRHCSHMTCGDANWCEKKEITLSDSKIRVHTKCGFWEWSPIDALTLEDPERDKAMAEKREKELYEKRMRGDWS